MGVHLTRISRIGLAALLLPLGAFAVWAAVDFSSAFTFFHETLFTNDLWLLNPETDLLLRLLPEQFFADIAATIAARPGVLRVVPLAIFGVKFGRKFI